MSFKPLPLDHPIRVGYHWLRGWLADTWYRHPSRSMIVIGVTGTKGKTTTSNIITRGLIHAGKKVCMFSTANWCMNGEFHENTTKMTSPSPFVLQRFLAEARSTGCEYAVIETSSHAVFYHRNHGIEYDTVVLTNIAQDHLDLHGTMDVYAQTKLRLFEGLVFYRRKGSIKKIGAINIDSSYAHLFLATTADALYTYGMNGGAQISASDIHLAGDTTDFILKLPSNRVQVHTHLRGMFNVYNILAAVSVLVGFAIPLEQIVEAIETMPSVP